MPEDKDSMRVTRSLNLSVIAATLMAAGLVGPHLSLLLTALPAALSVAVIALVLAIPRLGPGRDPPPDGSRLVRGVVAARRAVITGSAEAIEILRSRDLPVVAGAIGYWAFDNAVLWATFEAVGADVPISMACERARVRAAGRKNVCDPRSSSRR